MNQPQQPTLASVTRLCSSLLDGELQLSQRLELLLTDLATANLFSTDVATLLATRVAGLQREREKLALERSRCQKALALLLPRQVTEVRLSELEPLMHEADRTTFRKRRLEVISRAEGIQRLLRRADVQFRSRLFFFSDLIAALTGQTPSANCYSASGRRDAHVPTSMTHAIS